MLRVEQNRNMTKYSENAKAEFRQQRELRRKIGMEVYISESVACAGKRSAHEI